MILVYICNYVPLSFKFWKTVIPKPLLEISIFVCNVSIVRNSFNQTFSLMYYMRTCWHAYLSYYLVVLFQTELGWLLLLQLHEDIQVLTKATLDISQSLKLQQVSNNCVITNYIENLNQSKSGKVQLVYIVVWIQRMLAARTAILSQISMMFLLCILRLYFLYSTQCLNYTVNYSVPSQKSKHVRLLDWCVL